MLVVGLVIRYKLEENEEFVRAREKRAAAGAAMPALELLKRFPLTNLCVFLACFAVSGVYFRNVFALNWAVESQNITRDVFLNALLIGAFVQAVLTPLGALIADRVSVYRAQIVFTVVYLVVAPFPMLALISLGGVAAVYLGVVLSYVGHALYYATLSGFLATLFPTELRFTGISLGYQLSGSLVSGFVPLVAAAMVGAAAGAILPVQLPTPRWSRPRWSVSWRAAGPASVRPPATRPRCASGRRPDAAGAGGETRDPARHPAPGRCARRRAAAETRTALADDPGTRAVAGGEPAACDRR